VSTQGYIMSTIAYRNGIMAADSGVWYSDAVTSGIIKLVRSKDSSLYGYIGSLASSQQHAQWIKGGELGPEPLPVESSEHKGRANFAAMVVTIEGDIGYLGHEGIEKHGRAMYWACGAENVGALCAMSAGASAIDAIRAVINHTTGARGPIYWLTHDGSWGWDYP
jgi:hypothetical protein